MSTRVLRFLVGSFTDNLPHIFGGIGTDPAPAGLSLWEFDEDKLGHGECCRQLDAVPLIAPGALTKVGNLVVCGRETVATDGDLGRSGTCSDVLNLVRYDGSRFPHLKFMKSVTIPNCWTTCDFHHRVIDGVPLLFIANYFTSNGNVFQMTEEGMGIEHLLTFDSAGVVEPSRAIPKRQCYRHTHGVLTHPLNERTLFVPQLGCDAVSQFDVSVQKPKSLELDALAKVKLTHKNVLRFEAGDGPRTIFFHPKIPNIMYVSLELDFKIAVVRANADGSMELLQTVKVIPEDYTPGKTDISSMVSTNAEGSVLFTSTRGHESVFAVPIDAETGLLIEEKRVWTPCGGYSPRHFSVHPSDKYLFVANHGGGNDANITIFEIMQLGGGNVRLDKKHSFKVGCATWIEWITDDAGTRPKSML